MTIFTALNERLKASQQRQDLSTFEDTVNSELRSPQKQTCIEREFEVTKKKNQKKQNKPELISTSRLQVKQ